MKLGLYSKLAWTGIKKNRKLYIPYILSCVGMIAMFYIIHSLSASPLLKEMSGGGSLGSILGLGKFVIAAFALIFLIYTNSFLIRRRYKEFGLYNILGMDKRSISSVVALEAVIVAAISLVCGLGVGVAFSKLAELGLVNAIRGEVDYKFYVSWEAVRYTLGLYGAIFLVIFIKSIIQVRRSKPLELLKSENAGEKAPKANWIIAVLGAIILGVAYYLAITIKSPISAITIFFGAVLMVIVATYMLFISGSVALCKVLQKNKGYYYKKNHFVSVSSMVYRMKRNGAGLASICILSTMVLVSVSATTSLFFGENDTLNARYPVENQFNVSLKTMDNLTDGTLDAIEDRYDAVFDSYGLEPQNLVKYSYGYAIGLMADEDEINTDVDPYESSVGDYENLRELYFIPQADYNAATGENVSLKDGEALVCTKGCEYDRDSFHFKGIELKIVGEFKTFATFGDANAAITPAVMFVIPDMETLRSLDGLTDEYNGYPVLAVHWFYGYDVDADEETQINVYNDQQRAIKELGATNSAEAEAAEISYSCDCLANSRSDFFQGFGGLFFIAIMLSVVFIFAMAMIIYYKQISEGYEDKSRFEIMQKVGMTKEDIKKSINSQVLTVFFAPLIMAGIHLAFAFPLVWKLLQLFYLQNLNYVIWVTLASYVAFALIYGVIYKITAGAYYKIVSEN